jgi:hypothetical protein
MKFLKALAATACALALAGAAHATTYTDSSDNYPDGWSSGSNGGSGFGAWTLASSGNSWSGIWPLSEAGLKQGVWADKENAFAFVARGDNSSFTASRSFRAALAPGDSFSLEMGVNYDGDRVGSTKGFALTANGETIVTVNHEFDTDWTKSGWISINGENTGSDILNTYGTFPMTWTFTAKDATTLSVTATARDDSSKVYTADLTVATSAIDGFVLQSAQQTSDDVKERQTYFDNFALDIAGELHDLVTLQFTSGDWAVTNAPQDVSYTLTRSSSDGELVVNVKSSYEDFIPSGTVTFADGEDTATYPTTATLQPYAFNTADLTATAIGCNPDTFKNIRGPKFDREVKDGQWEFMPNDSATFWMHWYWDGFDVDCTKVTLSCEPAGAVVLPASLEWNPVDEVGDDGVKAWLESSFTVVSSGKILFQYDGVTFDDWDVTVKTIGFELSGPTSVKTDATATYTLKATLDGAEEGCNVTVAPSKGVTVDPVSFDLVDEKDGFYSQDIEITFATAGDYTVSVASANYSASIDVSVSEPVDPSLFDDYIAYDEADFYNEGFDYSAVGVGTDKFQPWQDYFSSNNPDEGRYAGATIVGSAADSSVLTGGQAFALYANGASGTGIELLRPFVNPLDAGQAFSVVLSPNFRNGTKGVKFVGSYGGSWYNRAEFLFNDDGYFFKPDGEDDSSSVNIGWDYPVNAVTLTLARSADGNSYDVTISTEGQDEFSQTGITHFRGAVDGVIFYSWDSTNEDGNNFVFNKLAIEQVATPDRRIWLDGNNNPDGPGDYTFTLGASTTDIGVVALAISEGASVSPDSIDLTGEKSATFTVTLDSANPGDKFTVTATPADTEVEPYSYDIYPVEPTSEIQLVSGAYEMKYVPGGTVTFKIVGSPARVGKTVTLDSGNPNVLAPPEPNTAVVAAYDDDNPPTFTYTMTGIEDGQVWIHAYDGDDEWGYAGITIKGKAGDDPYADILRITAMDKADPNMVLTVDGTPATAYGATEIVDGNWAWQPLDDATIAGDKVTVPMTGRPFLVIKVEK